MKAESIRELLMAPAEEYQAVKMLRDDPKRPCSECKEALEEHLVDKGYPFKCMFGSGSYRVGAYPMELQDESLSQMMKNVQQLRMAAQPAMGKTWSSNALRAYNGNIGGVQGNGGWGMGQMQGITAGGAPMGVSGTFTGAAETNAPNRNRITEILHRMQAKGEK